MAELDTSSGGGKGGKVRTKKQATRVDLTAMVDLAFLLITFFMLTTSLSKPLAMDIVKPVTDDKQDNKLQVPQSRTMTVLLGLDNKVMWYMGIAGSSTPTIEGINSIEKSLLDNKKKVKEATGKDIMVIIKPTSESTYKNFVDMMDWLNITETNITAPAIDDDPKNLLPEEIAFLKEYGLMKK
ncbi:MAG: biopolymer transporter ExbD [Pedobacter sp.]|nr:MAG: biopolymer transporter ExbD [Pedobacter sp.]